MQIVGGGGQDDSVAAGGSPALDKPGDAKPRRGCQITLASLLMLMASFGLCAAWLLPALSRVRENANVSNCSGHHRQTGAAAYAYSLRSNGPGGQSGFYPHVSSPSEEDAPEDVGEALSMLVRTSEIDDARIFICPSSNDVRVLIAVSDALEDFAFEDNDVRTSREFSYGWTRFQLTAQGIKSDSLIAGDRSIGDAGQKPDVISNHPSGRNVLRGDGSVMFVPRKYESPGHPSHDPKLLLSLDDLNLTNFRGPAVDSRNLHILFPIGVLLFIVALVQIFGGRTVAVVGLLGLAVLIGSYFVWAW